MRKRWKSETGSAMILALLFLLFCSLLGSALLASAWAGAGRVDRESQAQTDFLTCRSALMLLRADFSRNGQPQLTVRDVSVRENKTTTRTVTYTLQNCGNSLLAEYLVNYAITRYESDTGAPDVRYYENFPFQPAVETDAAKDIALTISEGRELTGLCTVSKDFDLHIRLKSGDGELVLTMEAVQGKSDPVKLTAGGVRPPTKTTVIRWEDGIIEKGGNP